MSEIVGVKLVIDGQEKIVKNMGELRKLLKEAQFEALAISSQFGETSKEAAAAAQKVAMLKDQIQDTSERVGLFDPGKKFQVFANTLSTAAGGISALQGAMGLLGTESEQTQQALLKVQSALALSQGLSVIADGAKDFQRLSAAVQQSTVFIKANEVVTKIAAATQRLFGLSVDATSTSFKVLKGAIAATGIGLLIVLLGEAVSWFNEYSSAADRAAKAQEDFNKSITKRANAELEARLKALDNIAKLDAARAKAAGATEEQIFNIEQNARRNKAKALQDYYNEVKTTDEEAAKDAKDRIETINIEGLVAQESFNERQNELRKEEAAKALEERLAAQKEAIDKQYQAELDAYEKRKKLRGKEQQELIDSFKTLTEREKEKKAAEEEQKKKDQEAIDRFMESNLAKSLELRLAADAKRLSDEKIASDASVAISKGESESKQILLETTGTALQNLSLVAGRETVAGKALAIASSIINTYQGATKALAQGGIAGPIAAAGIIAAGLAAVKNIVSVKVPGGGGASPSTPSLNTGSPLNPTTVAANQVTLDQRSINSIGNKAIRAYVIETEITAAQQKIRRISKQTTFG